MMNVMNDFYKSSHKERGLTLLCLAHKNRVPVQYERNVTGPTDCVPRYAKIFVAYPSFDTGVKSSHASVVLLLANCEVSLLSVLCTNMCERSDYVASRAIFLWRRETSRSSPTTPRPRDWGVPPCLFFIEPTGRPLSPRRAWSLDG